MAKTKPFRLKTIKHKGNRLERAAGLQEEYRLTQGGLQVGRFVYDESGDSWLVELCVIKKFPNEDGNPNCPWRWARLQQNWRELEQAQDWAIQNQEKIEASCTLHHIPKQ